MQILDPFPGLVHRIEVLLHAIVLMVGLAEELVAHRFGLVPLEGVRRTEVTPAIVTHLFQTRTLIPVIATLFDSDDPVFVVFVDFVGQSGASLSLLALKAAFLLRGHFNEANYFQNIRTGMNDQTEPR